MENNRLGKGLGALISSGTIKNTGGYIEDFDIEKITPNPYQPRMNFSNEELIELAESIKEHGVIQPLLITKNKNADDDTYFLIAGERRFRASKLAGLNVVPVVIKEASAQEMLELALIENIQRQDLNPLEEAQAYNQLSEEFGLTHSLIAQKVGFSRVAVTNKLRLLKLPESVKEYILKGDLTEGHARTLLGLTDPTALQSAANLVIKRNMSVRETEDLVRKINYGKDTQRTRRKVLNQEEEEFIDKLASITGLNVRIRKMSIGGKIEIRFKDEEEFKKITGIIRA